VKQFLFANRLALRLYQSGQQVDGFGRQDDAPSVAKQQMRPHIQAVVPKFVATTGSHRANSQGNS